MQSQLVLMLCHQQLHGNCPNITAMNSLRSPFSSCARYEFCTEGKVPLAPCIVCRVIAICITEEQKCLANHVQDTYKMAEQQLTQQMLEYLASFQRALLLLLPTGQAAEVVLPPVALLYQIKNNSV